MFPMIKRVKGCVSEFVTGIDGEKQTNTVSV